MANIISRKIKNPTWSNNAKTSIGCQIIIELDDGNINKFDASVSISEEPHSDWVAIMNEFGIEAIDAATTDYILKLNDEKEKARIDEIDRKNIEINAIKQEELFSIKLEAFEIPIIKNSIKRELKALIRKSKTAIEVQAYTTILLMKELDDPSPVQEVTENAPSE